MTISKPVFADPKPVFENLETGFWKSQNRFLAILKPVFENLKTSFSDDITGFWKSQNRCLPISKPVFFDGNRILKTSKQFFDDLKTGFF